MRYIHSRFVGFLMLLLVAACAAAGWVMYPQLPYEFISRWTFAGDPSGATSRFWGVAGIPLLMLGLFVIWSVLPKLDPLKGLVKSRYVYDFFWFLIIALFAYIQCLLLAVNVSPTLSISNALIPALAFFFFAIGALMPHMRRNWFIGIRTPWTLSNERVWKKTHELASTLFMAAGIVMLSGLFFPQVMTWVLVVPIALAAFSSVVYSYVVYRDK